jgi:rhodanese-related sulfurtransferase
MKHAASGSISFHFCQRVITTACLCLEGTASHFARHVRTRHDRFREHPVPPNSPFEMQCLGAVARPAAHASIGRGERDVRCAQRVLRSGTSRSRSCFPTSRGRTSTTTTTTYAAKAPFPVGTPEPNGIVPGIGKGMPKWPEVWRWLNEEKKMQTLDSLDCQKLVRKGAVLLDVRFEPDYEKWSIPGSVSVPYVTGGFLAKLRLPGFKKKNADFVRMVEAQIPDKKTKIVLACIWGGSLTREPPKNRGLTDNTKGGGSLPGAFELYQAGYTNLYHLYGGVNQWYQVRPWAFPKSRRLFQAPFVTIYCLLHTSQVTCLLIQVTNMARPTDTLGFYNHRIARLNRPSPRASEPGRATSSGKYFPFTTFH